MIKCKRKAVSHKWGCWGITVVKTQMQSSPFHSGTVVSRKTGSRNDAFEISILTYSLNHSHSRRAVCRGSTYSFAVGDAHVWQPPQHETTDLFLRLLAYRLSLLIIIKLHMPTRVQTTTGTSTTGTLNLRGSQSGPATEAFPDLAKNGVSRSL